MTVSIQRAFAGNPPRPPPGPDVQSLVWGMNSVPEVFSGHMGIYCDSTPERMTMTISEAPVSFNKHSPKRTGNNPVLTGSSQIFGTAIAFYCLVVTANTHGGRVLEPREIVTT